ncbi:hypothetical protein ACQUQP_12135 [Marinobacterium sp. YM272]|uniref:hypothetical protein n=1 Tax=Marinobacterium sp. YM272 TaxID=3421654 RepID=UPI003D7F6645
MNLNIDIKGVDKRSLQTLALGLLIALASVLLFLSFEYFQKNQAVQQRLLNHYSWLKTHQDEIVAAGGVELIFAGDLSLDELQAKAEQLAYQNRIEIHTEFENGGLILEAREQPQGLLIAFVESLVNQGVSLSSLRMIRSAKDGSLDLSVQLGAM